MMRRPGSEAWKLILVGVLCVSLGCATSRAPAPSGSPDPADPPAAESASTGSAPGDPPPGAVVDNANGGVPPAPDAAKTDSANADPTSADDDAAQKPKPQTVSQRRRQNQIARHAEAALESMIIGTVIGAQFGPIGAAIGAGTFALWGVITGDVPFEGGRRNAPPPGRSGGGTARGSDEEMENEVDDELKKKQDLEAEIEAELKHQEELLAAINKQEETNKAMSQEAKDCAGAETPADPTAAPKRPCQRDIPDQIFDTKTVKVDKQERIVKTLDADRDGKPEIKITIDPKSGEVLTREEDTDFDGKLDASNTYMPDGRLKERVVDTNADGKPDRWIEYGGSEVASRVEVDRNYDGKKDGYLQYQNGVLVYEEYDNNYDGKIDRRIEYVAGKRDVEIEDTNLDGVMDSRTYFDAKGLPARCEKDKNADGKPDVFEYFDTSDPTKVVLIKREEDTNGDGVVDITSYYEKGKLVRKEVSDPSAVN